MKYAKAFFADPIEKPANFVLCKSRFGEYFVTERDKRERKLIWEHREHFVSFHRNKVEAWKHAENLTLREAHNIQDLLKKIRRMKRKVK